MKTEIQTLLEKYLVGDALVFANNFLAYCHLIDDLIDEPTKRSDNEAIIAAFELSATVYSNPFYRAHAHYLYPIIKCATNAYADSVHFECNPQEWTGAYRAVLAQQANDVFLACIEIAHGPAVRRFVSIQLRELSYRLHQDSFEPKI